MLLDLKITHCSGIAQGTVYQFAEGAWPGHIRDGIFISEVAFDFVGPLIQKAWPDWDGLTRYGVTRMTRQSCLALVEELRRASEQSVNSLSPPKWQGYSGVQTSNQIKCEFDNNLQLYDEVSALLRGLADWLNGAMMRTPELLLLGI